MLGVVVIAFCVWSLLRPADRNDTPGTQDSSTADTPVSQPDSTESSDSGVTADSAAQDESPLSAPELTLYTTDLANNIGKIGYDEQQMVGGKTRLEMYRDVLKGYNLIPYTTEAGEKITIATGHQVSVKADDTSGQQYIVSGVDPIPVEHSVPDTRMTVKLRAEDTCERVRVFTSRETLERAQDAWERGQAILAGEEPAPENCVILNGCLLDTKWEQGEDGRRYLPMTDIAEAYDEQSEFYDVEGWLNVATDLQYVILPTALMPDIALEHFDVSDGTWRYANEKPPIWSDRFYLPQTDKTEMPIDDISRILGWKIYTNSEIVSIVTSELDVNDNFVLIESRTTEHIYDMNGNEITTEDAT